MIDFAAGCLYHGQVMHHRLRPKRHRFIYRVSAWLVDIDRLAELERGLKLFSVNRFNLFSLHERDHGDGSTRPLHTQVRETLSQAGLGDLDGPIRLLCYPRLLGYVFNPLSVYYCHDRHNRLRALLYEVSNTFGERHSYLIPVSAGSSSKLIRQQCDKSLYVSPFMPMETRYRFRLKAPSEHLALCISQQDHEGTLFHATFTGQREALSDRRLVRLFLSFPLMTLKIIAAIHWEAFRLWRKGVPLQPRQPAPANATTLVTANKETTG